MSFDADTLFRLLPAIHRIRDAELAAGLKGLLTPEEAAELAALEALPSPTVAEQERIEALRGKAARGPLKALLMAFADEFAVLEENLDQLYDDLFIETCADWAIPYIGDLIGYEPLHALGKARGLARAEVAHTIALRRRKGTVAVLEQLARDVTGWNARAVEFFQLLGTTQYLNHLRPHSRYAPDLRQWEPLARIGTAFDSTAHTVDVRRIESRRGRFNIPNVGIFLWRINAYPHTKSPAVRVDDRRYLVSPLGHPLQLYTNPVAEDEITRLAEPVNVPEPIGRRMLDARKALYYGFRESSGAEVDNAEPSVVLYADGIEVPRESVVACNLADDGGGWAHAPLSGSKYGIDPVLGRIALGDSVAVPQSLHVTYHYGFPADLGGGEYPRERRADAPGTSVIRVPQDHATIQAALAALAGDGVVEITDSGRYEETLTVNVKAGGHVVLRAAERCRPTLILGGDLSVTGGAESAFSLEGLLVAGARLHVPDAGNQLARLRIAHATLVPGLALNAAGDLVSPGAASLMVERPGVAVELERAIVGALRVVEGAKLAATDAILDANDPAATVYCTLDGVSPGGELSLAACTAIGKINADALGLVSNSILLARAAPGDTLPPVYARRRQTGCVRFSYLPFDSLVPRRYRCQPENAEGETQVAPHFASLRYGVPAYCQLMRSTPDEIRRGADDESEMGAYHMLFAAQREANLQIRLREFLRVGLSSGVFYET
jgi:hypothetical protein